ncbi:hypothetical protein D5F01_LYC22901 [Larimichthys crocea]|uniref:Uncharacterized protein n=1 Tax=Larimichthys crocea TaxID=215358 RepID=A0A6G0HJE6_LARCR|nr:hypothetical protein D5F01_LYC22901 [Larimichthys crocea]
MLKETDKTDKLKNMTVAEPTKGKDIVTKEKVMASKAEMDSTAQKSKTSVDKLAAAGAVAKEKVDETAAKAGSVPSKSTTSENRPDVETSKPKESETKVKEAVVVPKDTAKVVKQANVTEIEPKHQTKLDKANRAEDDEQMQLGETVENFKPKESETKVQEAVVVPKDSANVTEIEPKHQAKLDEANQAEDFEPMQLGETGVAEAIEVGSCADDKGQN